MQTSFPKEYDEIFMFEMLPQEIERKEAFLHKKRPGHEPGQTFGFSLRLLSLNNLS